MEKFGHFMVGFAVALIAWEGRSIIHNWIGSAFGIMDPITLSVIVIAIIGVLVVAAHFVARQFIK